jgi:hypothetical protein
MVRLARDPYMRETLAQWDIALLDTSEEQRSAITPEGLYAVERDAEAVLRYIRPGARCFYLVADATRNQPSRWEEIRIPPEDFPEFVKARVLWLGRERDRDLAQLDQLGRFLYEAISS